MPVGTVIGIHFYHGATAPVGQGLLIQEVSKSHSDTQHSVGLLWTSDQSVAETSTCQHTTLTTNKHQYPRRHSNLYSQQANGSRPTLRPRGHWDRRPWLDSINYTCFIIQILIIFITLFSPNSCHFSLSGRLLSSDQPYRYPTDLLLP